MDRTLYTTLLAYSFALLLAYLLFTILAPFLAALIWAGAISIITRPFYEKLLAICKGREITAAALLTAAVVLAVIIPLVGMMDITPIVALLLLQVVRQVVLGLLSGF